MSSPAFVPGIYFEYQYKRNFVLYLLRLRISKWKEIAEGKPFRFDRESIFHQPQINVNYPNVPKQK